MCTFLHVGIVHCLHTREIQLKHMCMFPQLTTTLSSDVRMHSTATAIAVEKSLKEEQEKRAEAERRVQLLEQRVSGEMAALMEFIMSLL